MASSPSFEDLIDGMTLEVWHNMRTAVETGRWPDGRRVSDEQRALCMQAVIAWEVRNLPEEERSGYVPSNCKSADSEAPDQPVDLRPARRPGEH
ncbi:YeaC family protein [Alloalcanivorax sp.]|uniref:YeaC family protein n=1 Tax=Alloalcanivorax sp. TaxID=3020835 RepID=UPI003512996A